MRSARNVVSRRLYGRIGGGDAFSATCPGGQSVVVHGGRFGAVVDQLRLGCAPVLIDGIDARPGEASFIDPVGGEGGVAYGDTGCPDGQFAIGAIVRAASSTRSVSSALSWASHLAYSFWRAPDRSI